MNIKKPEPKDIYKGKLYFDGDFGGDFIYGDVSLLGTFLPKLFDKKFILLEYISNNTFEALKTIGIDETYFDNFKYNCPFTHRDYYAVVPVAIISPDIKKYEQFFRLKELALDYKYNRDYFNESLDIDDVLPSVMKYMIGPGYTMMCYPSDGSKDKTYCTIPLDNGDIIVCINYLWFNK